MKKNSENIENKNTETGNNRETPVTRVTTVKATTKMVAKNDYYYDNCPNLILHNPNTNQKRNKQESAQIQNKNPKPVNLPPPSENKKKGGAPVTNFAAHGLSKVRAEAPWLMS